MKGPFERLKYDLRRVWECPRCHHRERTPGTTTSCICRCQAKEEPLKRVCMKLVEDGARRKTVPLVAEVPPADAVPSVEVAPSNPAVVPEEASNVPPTPQ